MPIDLIAKFEAGPTARFLSLLSEWMDACTRGLELLDIGCVEEAAECLREAQALQAEFAKLSYGLIGHC